MKYVNKISNILLLFIIGVSTNLTAQTSCEDPLSLEWLQFSLGDPCVDGIYSFEYNEDAYVYIVSKPECIAADARNTLFNCTENSFCYYFGLTLPQDQCDQSLIDAITPLLTNENLIYPLSISRTCENPLALPWVQETLSASCTDGIYAFEHNGTSYIYRSTACEYVDDPNRLYNCDDKSYCFVDGKTLPEDQCDLTAFPLQSYLTDRNLIWSSPLLRLIPEYSWLTSKVDFKNCDDVEIKEFKTVTADYLSIKNTNTTDLYARNGSLLCTNTNNFDCEAAYGLSIPEEEWVCGRTNPPVVCGIDEPQENLPWLQQLIEDTNCDCNASIVQYCYNGEVYFDSTPLDPGYCADYAGFVYDVEGNVICQNGGITGGNCLQEIPDFFEFAEQISVIWSCNNNNAGCESLQFASINSSCECCNDIILYEVTGGDGNYEVTTLDGTAIINGMSTASLPIGVNELIVTDGQGCTAEGIFQNFPFCCEVPPVCEGLQISYNCTDGLQLSGYGDCNSIAVKDTEGNIYNEGDHLTDGSYTLIEANEGQVNPACTTAIINVNCSDGSACNLAPDSGPCEAYIPRFYYDTEAEECMQFIYGGCQGNNNNYETYEICTDACGYNYTCPSIEDPLEELAWLQKITQNANGCSVNQITQFIYNENIYFQTIPSFGGGFCPADLPLQYYNCDGLRICSLGFSPFPTCNQAMVDAANDNGKIIWTYGEDNNNCNNLQFDEVFVDCDACCNETLSFAISGGDGDYEVTTSDGLAVYNGMPWPLDIAYYYGLVITLIVTDGQGCTAEQSFTYQNWCCEVPPQCTSPDLTYACFEGLQVIGEGQCDNISFTDEAGNSYESGAILEDGNYLLTSTSRPCGTYELTVNCADIPDYCNFEDVEITSNPDLCGEAIITLTTNEVFRNEGPDDNEIVFVKVANDNTFEVLDDPNIFEASHCYFAVAYRWSCGAPDFYTNNFNDITDNAEAYKVSDCFTVNYIQAPEYSITTEPYCDGEGLFTVGVTISGGSGAYLVGQDYTGENVYGETGQNFITFASGQEFYDIYPTDAETGCANDYVIPVEDPSCGILNICELPMVVGPCEALIPRFYYDAEQGDCIEFEYGGCEGNANNFETYTACIEACGNANQGCDDPLQLEFVQDAINNPTCTEAVYAFNYQNNDYVFVKSACAAVDLFSTLYNCNTDEFCSIGGIPLPMPSACDELYSEVSNLIIDENIIWQPNLGCGCSRDYTPVCGIDGNTYSNACQAECVGVEIAYEGECEEPCICPAVYEPVCGVDGITYGNECEAACEGIEIAYEGECDRVELNCSVGDPLEWLWLKSLIVENAGCLITEVRTFTYQGTAHFYTLPGYPSNLTCASDAPSSYYNCEGDRICQTGFFPPDFPGLCNDDVLAAAASATTIWTYNDTNCADPFELELVQQAIENDACTGGIYAFGFENESYIYIQTLCEFVDDANVLYNCNTGVSCVIGGEWFDVDPCHQRLEEVSDLINEQNLIWTKPCAYETPGTVRDFTGLDGCSFIIEFDDGRIIEPFNVPDDFTFIDGQQVELTYRISTMYASICQVGPIAEIICIRAINEGCACDDVYDPVCGVDGITYANACQAQCEGIELANQGECEEACICITLYDPVCGVDGNTYGNACEAACAGVAIDYEGTCSENSIVFDRFTWLNSIVDPVFCANGVTVTEYTWFDAYSFVYIQTPEGAGKLYYQDGTYYCTDEPGYNCAEVYGLTSIVNNWTCTSDGGPNEDLTVTLSDNIICNDDGSFSIELNVSGGSGAFGAYHSYGEGLPEFIRFNEAESIIFSGNVSDAVDGLFRFFVYDDNLADAPAKMLTVDVSNCIGVPNSDLFNQYSWLQDIVDENNCSPGYSINEYDFGTYSFVHIQINNTGSLYLGDGTFYCEDDNGSDCISLYGFGNPSSNNACISLVNCPDVFEPVCGADGNTYNNACLAERAGISVAYDGACRNVELFNQYPWLNTLIDPNDCNANSFVSEYDLGDYSFVFVQHNGEGALYFQDGTFYCTDTPGYSCTGAYGFTNESAIWNCGEGTIKKGEQSAYLAFDNSFKIYPNPNYGQFKVELLGTNDTIQTINITTLNGQLVETIKLGEAQSLIDVDLKHIPKGIYLVEFQTSERIKTQKVIIH